MRPTDAMNGTTADDKQTPEHGGGKGGAIQTYTTINQEVATLMPESDRIVFGPAEDFEDLTPLEDFKKTQSSPSATI